MVPSGEMGVCSPSASVVCVKFSKLVMVVVNDHLVSDPAKRVNLADPDVAALVQQLIDTADDLARRGSREAKA